MAFAKPSTASVASQSSSGKEQSPFASKTSKFARFLKSCPRLTLSKSRTSSSLSSSPSSASSASSLSKASTGPRIRPRYVLPTANVWHSDYDYDTDYTTMSLEESEVKHQTLTKDDVLLAIPIPVEAPLVVETQRAPPHLVAWLAPLINFTYIRDVVSSQCVGSDIRLKVKRSYAEVATAMSPAVAALTCAYVASCAAAFRAYVTFTDIAETIIAALAPAYHFVKRLISYSYPAATILYAVNLTLLIVVAVWATMIFAGFIALVSVFVIDQFHDIIIALTYNHIHGRLPANRFTHLLLFL